MKVIYVFLCFLVLLTCSSEAKKKKKVLIDLRKWRKHIEGSCVIHYCQWDWQCTGEIKVYHVDELIEGVWVPTYAGCQTPPYGLGPSRCCRFPRVPETKEYYQTHAVGK